MLIVYWCGRYDRNIHKCCYQSGNARLIVNWNIPRRHCMENLYSERFPWLEAEELLCFANVCQKETATELLRDVSAIQYKIVRYCSNSLQRQYRLTNILSGEVFFATDRRPAHTKKLDVVLVVALDRLASAGAQGSGERGERYLRFFLWPLSTSTLATRSMEWKNCPRVQRLRA